MWSDENDITYGLDSTIWKGIEKTFDKNSTETFRVLNEFVHKVILTSIENNSLEHFKKYVIFYPSYYHVTYQRYQDSQQYKKLHNLATQAGVTGARRLLSVYLRYDKKAIKANDLAKLSVNNDYIYHVFNVFSRLFYSALGNKDLNMFRYILTEFNQVDNLGYYDFRNLRLGIRIYPDRNPNLESDMKLYAVISMFQVYRRHVIMGIKFWAYYMYLLKILDEDFLAETIDKLRIYGDSNELLEDIIAIRNKGWDGYFEWMSWDFMERPSGDASNPPNSRDWLTFGFLVDIIRERRLIFSPNNYSLKELQEIAFLYDSLKDHKKVLIDNFEKWKGILKVKDKEELEMLLQRLFYTLEQFKNRNITEKERAIAEAKLSDVKVQEFNRETGEAWELASLFRNLFKNFENRKEVAKEFIDQIGFSTVFIGGKKMFIEDSENYGSIYGGGEAGRRVAKLTDQAFTDKLDDGNPSILNGENLLDVVQKCIESLSSRDFRTNVIAIPGEYGYTDDSLVNHKDFIWRDKAQKIHSLLDNFVLGYFKGIPVYNNHSVSSKILVCDFKAAFTMKFVSNNVWYDSELSVNVSEINEHSARSMFEKQKDYWENRSQLSQFSDDDIVLNIMNAVNLDVYSYNMFEITNKEAYAIGILYNDE